jgi:PAS domain S-box-containing protein
MKTQLDTHALVAAMGDAVVVCDRDGLITLWNPGATRMFGYSEDEALGQTLNLITPERLRARHHDGYAHSMETGTTRYGNDVLRVPAINKAGQNMSIAFTVAMLKDEAGEVTGVAAVIRDETARFEQDRALKKRLMELEAAAAKTSP